MMLRRGVIAVRRLVERQEGVVVDVRIGFLLLEVSVLGHVLVVSLGESRALDRVIVSTFLHCFYRI